MFEIEYKPNVVEKNVQKNQWFTLQDKNWATFYKLNRQSSVLVEASRLPLERLRPLLNFSEFVRSWQYDSCFLIFLNPLFFIVCFLWYIYCKFGLHRSNLLQFIYCTMQKNAKQKIYLDINNYIFVRSLRWIHGGVEQVAWSSSRCMCSTTWQL